MFLRSFFTSLLLICSFSALAATEVVQLNYRTSDDLLPVAKSFLGKEGTVSAYGNQLIVNAEPGKIGELRDLLGQLDKAPKRLMISVATSSTAAPAAATAAYSRCKPVKACPHSFRLGNPCR